MALTDLATAAQLAVRSNGKLSQTDPRIPDALQGVSRAIRNYCGWHVTPVDTQTLTLDGPGGRELDLPTLHVTDVASVVQHGETLDASTYEWSALGNIRRLSGWWTDHYRSIQVTMTHGYEDAMDVADVALAIVLRELSSPTGATREQVGQVSVSWAITAPGVSGGLAVLGPEYAILDAYRIVSA